MTDNEIINAVEYYNAEVARILNKPEQQLDIKFSMSKRNAGTCLRLSNRKSIITISRLLANVRTEHDTHNTIVHELCHAYNDSCDKHGPNWKRIAKFVGNRLGFNITRTFLLSDEITEKIKTNKPIALIEVPEIGYKHYIYKKCKGYKQEYKNYFLHHEGKKYSLVFTKLEG